MNLYLHIPFCRKKCIYCDFYSVGDRLANWSALVDALIAEGEGRVPNAALSAYPSTIYIGGGTPSLMPSEEFLRLAAAMRRMVPDVQEFTVEVNPDDVTEERVHVWREAGVNRVSMGVQTLCDAELAVIGRRHTAEDARRAAKLLRENFPNVSLDLMFGLPGQSLESFRKSVEGVLALHPDHISAYSLMYEERTALTALRDSGRLQEADENLSVEMYMMLGELLAQAGFEQYELSNYARPGFRSKHNGMYWLGLPYVGLGPAAHSYDGKCLRRANLPDVKRYLESPLDCFEEETLGADELREEMIMTRLRTCEGLRVEEFRARFGDREAERLLKGAKRFIDEELLKFREGNLVLTREGVMVSDEVIGGMF